MPHYELKPGYARQIERFDVTEEEAFRERWLAVYRSSGSCAWVVEDDGTRLGHLEHGRRGNHEPGVVLNHCIDCSKNFTDKTIERACFACLIAQRPTIYT
jgi:hypothetical protein